MYAGGEPPGGLHQGQIMWVAICRASAATASTSGIPAATAANAYVVSTTTSSLSATACGISATAGFLSATACGISATAGSNTSTTSLLSTAAATSYRPTCTRNEIPVTTATAFSRLLKAKNMSDMYRCCSNILAQEKSNVI